jgi:hypothetical protein
MVVYVKGNALAVENELTELKGIMREAVFQLKPHLAKQNAAIVEVTVGKSKPES